MKDKIVQRIQTELAHYHSMGEGAKRMLASYGLVVMAWPMVATFINAYLWQQGEGINRLVVYNSLFFTGLPIGFYLNKYILKKLHVLKVYYLGSVLQGLSALLVVFYPANELYVLGVYGLIFGVGSGLYWANKSYITLRLTRGKIIVPALVGWFLVVGEINGWYSKEIAYKIMLGVGMLLLFGCGAIVQATEVDDFEVGSVRLKNVILEWGWVRKYSFLVNIYRGSQD